LFIEDNNKAFFGTGSDLEIYHNGTSGSIRNNTGDILISALEADSNIKFYTDNGVGTTVSNLEISGSTGTVSLKYYGSQKLYTTNTGISVTGRISQLTDPSAAQDAATKAYVDSQVTAQDLDFSGDSGNGSVDLDSQTFAIVGTSNEIETSASGQQLQVGIVDNPHISGIINTDGLDVGDNEKIRLGNSQDLEIYHDGSNSYITDSGTGRLRLKSSTQIDFLNAAGNETLANFIENGAVKLYYDNSLKFETTSTGVTVTGNATVSGGDITVSNAITGVSGGSFRVKNNGGTTIATFADNLNTTFAGDVLINGNGKVLDLTDGNYLRLGDNQDLQIVHTFGGESIIDSFSGAFKIRQRVQNVNLTFGTYSAIEAMVIDTNGNVGIGTTTPDSLLHVAADVSVANVGTITIEGRPTGFLGDDIATIDFHNNGTKLADIRMERGNAFNDSQIVISTSDAGTLNDALIINEAGNVGIGTSSVTTHKLIVSGGSNIASFRSEGSGQNLKKLSISTGGDRVVLDASTTTDTTTAFAFQTGGVEKMRIDSSGNVGIGTTAPTAKLDIRQTADGVGVRIYGYDDRSAEYLRIFDTGSSGVYGATGNVKLESGGSGYVFLDSNNDIFFDVGSSGFNFRFRDGAGNELVRIKGNGNVGIGTTSPVYKLDVRSSGNLFYGQTDLNNNTSVFRLKGNGGASSLFEVLADGNVGIGTTNPISLLQVGTNLASDGVAYIGDYDSSFATNFFYRNQTAAQSTVPMMLIRQTNTSDDQPVLVLDQDGTGDILQAFTDTSQVVTIDYQGNVGIGTTSPSYRFTAYDSNTNNEIVASFGSGNAFNEYTAIGLSGFIASNGATKAGIALKRTASYGTGELHFLNNNTIDNSDMTLSDSKMMINASGNVGIGTTNPLYALDVAGEIRSSSRLWLSSIDAISISGSDLRVGYSNSNLLFRTNSGERMRIDSSGNVGIGGASTFASGTNIEVIDSSIARLGFTNNSANGHQFAWYAGTTGQAVLYDYTDSVPLLSFQAGSQIFYGIIRVRPSGGGSNNIELNPNGNSFLNGGNVGIGTTTPSQLLSIRKDSSTAYSTNDTNTNTGDFVLQNNNQTDDNFNRISFQSTSSNNQTGDLLDAARITAIYADHAGANPSGELAFETKNDSGTMAEAMRIDRDRNIGIGTDSPQTKLHIEGLTRITEGGNTAFYSGNYVRLFNSQAFQFRNSSGSTISQINLSGDSYFNGGNVGIGTTSPATGKLVVTGSPYVITNSGQARGGIDIRSNVNPGNGLYTGGISFGGTSSGRAAISSYQGSSDSDRQGLVFFTHGSAIGIDDAEERMRITDGGDVLIGATGTPNGTSVYGSGFINASNDRAQLRMASNTTGGLDLIQFYNPNGLIGRIFTNGSATSYVTSSDYRLKEDLQDFNGLDKVSKIPVYDFKWKSDESRSYGVMAHELQEVLPQAVSGEKDAEEMQGVDYSKIVPLLVKSIQELKAEIEQLKTQINK
jgi:hypothetical protein